MLHFSTGFLVLNRCLKTLNVCGDSLGQLTQLDHLVLHVTMAAQIKSLLFGT